MRRVRRPLLALIALLAALAVGYGVRAADGCCRPSHPNPATTTPSPHPAHRTGVTGR